MSDTIEVRDHSQPCEHGYKSAHQPSKADGYGWCYGGRKIVLRKRHGIVTGSPTRTLYPTNNAIEADSHVWVEVSDE